MASAPLTCGTRLVPAPVCVDHIDAAMASDLQIAGPPLWHTTGVHQLCAPSAQHVWQSCLLMFARVRPEQENTCEYDQILMFRSC